MYTDYKQMCHFTSEIFEFNFSCKDFKDGC